MGSASDYEMCKNVIDAGELPLREVHSSLEQHNTAASLGGGDQAHKHKELKKGQEIYIWSKLRRKSAWNNMRLERDASDIGSAGTFHAWGKVGFSLKTKENH